jgi:fatty-acid desaturase
MVRGTLAPTRGERALGLLSVALLALMHAACLLVFFVPFTWAALALGVGGYVLRRWAITAGYHRLLSHRSYRAGRAFQLVVAVLGTTALGYVVPISAVIVGLLVLVALSYRQTIFAYPHGGGSYTVS